VLLWLFCHYSRQIKCRLFSTSGLGVKSRLLLTLTHAAGDQIKSMIANIREGLGHVLASAPQLPKPDR
jgi:hypothetical protein